MINLALPRVMADMRLPDRADRQNTTSPPRKSSTLETYLKGNERNGADGGELPRFIADQSDARPFFLYFATSDPHRGGGVDKNSKLELK
ncbi:MAG: hypothetical protein R3F11_18120 [Verrucomicrobiales bacterium]